MTIISSDERAHYRRENTRLITLPDGQTEPVYMPPSLWIQYQALLGLENLQEADMVGFALEEKSVQDHGVTFSECFRCVVTDRVLDWYEAAESLGITDGSLGLSVNED